MILTLKNTDFTNIKDPFGQIIQMLIKQYYQIKSLDLKMILNIFLASRILKNQTFMHIFFPKMSACTRDFDKTKCMSFLIKDEKLLEKCNEIWK